jgi:chemotaxis protein MotB
MHDSAPIIIKKKKAHGHAHHGGSWKVAYADFVTAMMAFFMVMWIMGLSDETRTSIQGYFNDPTGFLRTHPRSKNIISSGLPKSKPSTSKENGDDRQGKEEAAKKLERKLKAEVEKAARAGGEDLKALLDGVEIALTEEGLQIEFIERHRTFFQIGSAAIRPEALPIVESIGRALSRTGRPMVIDGHTDSRPLTNPKYNNWDLSTDRAATLRRVFQRVGVDERQVMQVRGNADRRLRVPDDPYSQENRRVTVLLPYRVAGMPGEALAQQTEEALGGEASFRPTAPKIRP